MIYIDSSLFQIRICSAFWGHLWSSCRLSRGFGRFFGGPAGDGAAGMFSRKPYKIQGFMIILPWYTDCCSAFRWWFWWYLCVFDGYGWQKWPSKRSEHDGFGKKHGDFTMFTMFELLLPWFYHGFLPWFQHRINQDLGSTRLWRPPAPVTPGIWKHGPKTA